jgi:hypothetical protein
MCKPELTTERLNRIPFIDGPQHNLNLDSEAAVTWEGKLPRLFPVESCVEGPPPSLSGILKGCEIDTGDCRASCEVGDGSLPDKTVADAIAQALIRKQLAADDSPLVLMNVPFRPLEGEISWRLKLPDNLHGSFTSPLLNMKQVSCNIAVEGAFVNFHIDNGAAGFALLAGAQKLWIFAPCTIGNCNLVAKLSTSANSFAILIRKLEGLVFVRQTPAHALWFRSGTIHCTFTEVGGALYGPSESIGIAEDVLLIGRSFQTQQAIVTQEEKRKIAHLYCWAINVAISTGETSEMLQNAQESLESSDMQKAITKNWAMFDRLPKAYYGQIVGNGKQVSKTTKGKRRY